MKFDWTISMGNWIAMATFIITAMITLWKIRKAQHNDHEKRLKQLEDSCITMTNCVATIKDMLKRLPCVDHPDEYFAQRGRQTRNG